MPFHFDQHLSARIRSSGRSTLPLWIFLASHGMWGFGILCAFLVWRGVMPWFDALIPVVLTHMVTLLVQQLVRRERPPLSESKIVMWRRTPSFPSAHSSGSMAFATAIAFSALSLGEFGVWCGVVAVILALAVGISRIVVGVHYVTDVLCGWIFGILITGIFLSVV